MNKPKQFDITKLNIAQFGYSHFNKVEVDRYLTKLGHLHLILEHAMLMQVNLNLDHTVIGSIMNNLPKNGVEFSRLTTMKYDKREISIPASKILSRIEQ